MSMAGPRTPGIRMGRIRFVHSLSLAALREAILRKDVFELCHLNRSFRAFRKAIRSLSH